jgi:hypothetical protein
VRISLNETRKVKILQNFNHNMNFKMFLLVLASFLRFIPAKTLLMLGDSSISQKNSRITDFISTCFYYLGNFSLTTIDNNTFCDVDFNFDSLPPADIIIVVPGTECIVNRICSIEHFADVLKISLTSLLKRKSIERIIVTSPLLLGEMVDGSNPFDDDFEEFSAVCEAATNHKDSRIQWLDLRSLILKYLERNNRDNLPSSLLTFDGFRHNNKGSMFIAAHILLTLNLAHVAFVLIEKEVSLELQNRPPRDEDIALIRMILSVMPESAIQSQLHTQPEHQIFVQNLLEGSREYHWELNPQFFRHQLTPEQSEHLLDFTDESLDNWLKVSEQFVSSEIYSGDASHVEL